MFSHLKAEDFVNLMEGDGLSAGHRSHIDGCARCRSTWESMRSVHAEISSLETGIPEPDWAHFRSSVRDELLSRSIQRQSAVRRWTGWAIRPAVAWALSLVMAVGITMIAVLWNVDGRAPDPASGTTVTAVTVEAPLNEPVEMIGAGPQRSLFDDVVLLGEEEQERFRQMLEASATGPTYEQ